MFNRLVINDKQPYYIFSEDITAPDISTFARPTITASIVMNPDKKGENIYFCDIQFSDMPLLFQIEWSLSSKLSRDRILRLSDFVEYDTQATFRDLTALRELDLRANDVTKMGYTVSKI